MHPRSGRAAFREKLKQNLEKTGGLHCQRAAVARPLPRKVADKTKTTVKHEKAKGANGVKQNKRGVSPSGRASPAGSTDGYGGGGVFPADVTTTGSLYPPVNQPFNDLQQNGGHQPSGVSCGNPQPDSRLSNGRRSKIRSSKVYKSSAGRRANGQKLNGRKPNGGASQVTARKPGSRRSSTNTGRRATNDIAMSPHNLLPEMGTAGTITPVEGGLGTFDSNTIKVSTCGSKQGGSMERGERWRRLIQVLSFFLIV